MKTAHHHLGALQALGFACAILSGSLVAGSRDQDILELRQQIGRLDQSLRILERKEEISDEATAEAAKRIARVTSDEGGFFVSSPDRTFRLNFKVLAQADSRVFFNSSRIPGTTTSISQSGFLLRRIRPILAGTVGGRYEFAIVPEFGGGDATASLAALQDAWVSIGLASGFSVKAGKFTSPVALEPGANRHFIESPFVNTLLPNRDIGVELIGTLPKASIDFRAGVYNGARNNSASFARDGDNDKTFAGRVTWSPFRGSDNLISGLGVGLGGSVGREKGPGSSALQSPVTNAQQLLISFGNLAVDGKHVRISPSVFLYAGAFSFVAEHALEKQEVANGPVAFSSENTASRATLGYVLTGEDSTSRGVTPRINFKPGESWGALEAVARVSGIQFDEDLFDSMKGALPNSSIHANATGAAAYGVGLNWFLSRNLALFFNYELTDFEGKTQRPKESAFFSRAQISF